MKLTILAAALVLPASAPAGHPEPAPNEPPQPSMHLPSPPVNEHFFDMPNALSVGGPNCLPIARQIDIEEKRLRRSDARRLDREPMAHGFLAVDRQVGGCREVTFLRRNVAPAAPAEQGD